MFLNDQNWFIQVLLRFWKIQNNRSSYWLSWYFVVCTKKPKMLGTRKDFGKKKKTVGVQNGMSGTKWIDVCNVFMFDWKTIEWLMKLWSYFVHSNILCNCNLLIEIDRLTANLPIGGPPCSAELFDALRLSNSTTKNQEIFRKRIIYICLIKLIVSSTVIGEMVELMNYCLHSTLSCILRAFALILYDSNLIEKYVEMPSVFVLLFASILSH